MYLQQARICYDISIVFSFFVTLELIFQQFVVAYFAIDFVLNVAHGLESDFVGYLFAATDLGLYIIAKFAMVSYFMLLLKNMLELHSTKKILHPCFYVLQHS